MSLLFLMTFMLSFTYKSQLDCSSIKTGQFYYFSRNDRTRVDIIRTNDMQMETNLKERRVLKSKIIWKGNCSYDMYINSLSESKLDDVGKILASVPTAVNILKIENGYYVAKWNVKVLNREMEGVDTIYIKK